MKKQLLILLTTLGLLFASKNSFSQFVTANDYTPCLGQLVTFIVPDSLGIRFIWNFGDGTIDTIQNGGPSAKRSHAYSLSGLYNVTVTQYDGGWNLVLFSTSEYPIQVNTPGQIFTSTDTVCLGTQLQISIGNTPTTYTEVKWNMGDGSSDSTTYDVYYSHTYANVGTYTITAIAQGGECGNDTIEKVISVSATVLPNSAFYSSANLVCPNTKVNFSPDDQSSTLSFKWWFGDGDSSITDFTSHAYTSIGTYTVTLMTTSLCGTSSTTDTVQVKNDVRFSSINLYADTASAYCPGETVYFQVGADLSPTQAVWVFGDGDTVIANNIDQQTEHIYSAIGNYTGSITLTNGCGFDTSLTFVIKVGDSPFKQPLYIGTSSSGIICPGETINFFNNSQEAISYLWDFGDNSSYSNLSEVNHTYADTGVYTVTLKGYNGCGNVATSTFQVTVIDTNMAYVEFEENAGVSATNACPGDTVLFYSALAKSYLWDFGDGTTTSKAEPLIIGSSQFALFKHVYTTTGTKKVTLTIENFCGNTASDSTQITIGNSAAVQGGIIIGSENNNTCKKINFLAFGGNKFIWNFGNGDIDTTTTGSYTYQYATAGTYTVSVTITNGCGNSKIYEEPITIDDMTLYSSVANASCYGYYGNIIVGVGYGAEPLTYSWSNNETTPNIQVTAGTYSLTVTDANGCSLTEVYTVTEPAEIMLSVSETAPACGNSDGAISVSVTSGGVTPYSYSWSNGSTDQNLSNLSGGLYELTLYDANYCEVKRGVALNNPSTITATIAATDEKCFKSCDGELVVSVSGGSTPYTYSWNTLFPQSNDTASALCASVYFVQITDAANCVYVIGDTVMGPNGINISTSTTPATCAGEPDGSATAVVTGGTPDYTYSWNNVSASNPATNLTGGTYTLVVTDNNGCTETTSVVISEPAALSAVATQTGYDTAFVSVSGGTKPYDYVWSINPVQTTAIATGLSNQTYTVTIIDANGCTGTASVNIVITGSVGVKNVNTDFQVYPNPANEAVFIEAYQNELTTASITISNIIGERLITLPNEAVKGNYRKQIDISKLPNGIYFITIESAGNRMIKKIVVN